MKTINENFKAIVEKLVSDGNKITNIARAMGYTTTVQLYNPLNGKSAMTSTALQKFVNAYKVNPVYLFHGTGLMFDEVPNDNNIGYVVYNTISKAYLGQSNCFMVNLKSAIIYNDEIHASSVMINYNQYYPGSPFANNLIVLPVELKVIE